MIKSPCTDCSKNKDHKTWHEKPCMKDCKKLHDVQMHGLRLKNSDDIKSGEHDNFPGGIDLTNTKRDMK